MAPRGPSATSPVPPSVVPPVLPPAKSPEKAPGKPSVMSPVPP
ncbi:PREDICTED: verprolin-like [Apaloderma vittatum]|nr:PREDICTED: verprolin-like [Apaloderma vittatum]